MSTIDPSADEKPGTPKPPPYQVDRDVHKIETLQLNGDQRIVIRHDYTALNAANEGLLLTREKDTERISEKMTKGRSRGHVPDLTPEEVFYASLVRGGGWRPYGLSPVQSPDAIPVAVRDLYEEGEDGQWVPGWHPLDRGTMLRFAAEYKRKANDAFVRCRGRYVASGTGLDFMFEDGGLMRIVLGIGDFDEPAYRLLFELRRPASKRRTKFRNDFSYQIDHNPAGDMGKVETRYNLREGIDFFNEYLAAPVDGDEYSAIVFEDKRAAGDVAEVEEFESAGVRAYTDALRGDLLHHLNPMYKVEVAAAAVEHFTKTDRE